MYEWLIWAAEKLLLGLLSFVGGLLFLIAFVAALFFIAVLIGKFLELFSTEIKDPDLGLVQISFGSGSGKMKLAGKRRTPFTLPAPKKQIMPEARAMLLEARANWDNIYNQLLVHFADEIVEEGIPPETIKRTKWVEKLARERDLENLQRFTKLESVTVEHAEKDGPLQLRISTMHRWDPEHDRVLMLDEKLNVKFYALGCQC